MALFFSFILFVGFSVTGIKSYADWTNNAYDFVNKYGENKAIYNLENGNGYFYFGQKGRTRSSDANYYRIIGFNFYVTSPDGLKYHAGMNIPNNVNATYQSKVNGYTYDLWKFSVDQLIYRLKEKNPGVNFDFIKDGSKGETKFIFNAIVIMYNYQGNNLGNINADGTLAWGKIITSWNDPNWKLTLSDGSTWTPPVSERKALYGILGVIPASLKPVPTLSITSFPLKPGQSSMPCVKYVNGNDHWVNLRDPFTIYSESSIPSRFGFTDYNYISLDLNGAMFTSGMSASAYDGTIRGIGPYFNNFFSMNEFVPGTSTSPSSYNYRYARFVMTAKKDNQDFRLSNTVVKDGIYPPWAPTVHWVKTDGTAPRSDYAPRHKMNGVNDLHLMQQGIYDSRSGLDTNTIYAYVYKDGTGNKGPRIPLGKLNQYSDWGTDMNLESYDHLRGVYGSIRVEVWASDNVQNEGCVSNTTVNRAIPKPVSTSILINKYDYEDATTKWVRANNEFHIIQEGYALGVNPTQSNIRISRTQHYNDPSTSNAYSLTLNAQDAWTSNTPHIIRTRDTYLSLNSYTVGNEYRNYGTGNFYHKATADLNGYKFFVYGSTRVDLNGTAYVSTYIREPKLLGIDGKAPNINYSTTNNTSTVYIDDAESGFNRAEVTIDGHTQTHYTPTFTVTSRNPITITAYDNVGNHYTKVINSTYGWEGKYIQTRETIVNGKKVLEYRVDAEVWDLTMNNNVPTLHNRALRFSARSDLYLTTTRYKNAVNTIYDSGYIEDKYNQPYGPPARYENNNSTYSFVRWNHIEDVNDVADFNLTKDANPWDSVRRIFASGRKDYKWVLYQTNDRYGNSVTRTKVGEGTIEGNEVDVSNYKTGSYEMEITMYDYNRNPSGTTLLKFNHVQPEIKTDITDLFLKVTAVKDLNWESMEYPIKYNALDFPLGANKLSKNGEGIKLGYVVNYSIENMIKHNLSDYKVEYTLLGQNGEFLSGTSNGKSFRDSDAQDGTGYLVQNKSHIISDRDPSPDPSNNGFDARLFFKHFLPADAEFYTNDGQPYRGKVLVRAKITLTEVGTNGDVGVRDYVVDLYTIDTSGTAYDDLNMDKQR